MSIFSLKLFGAFLFPVLAGALHLSAAEPVLNVTAANSAGRGIEKTKEGNTEVFSFTCADDKFFSARSQRPLGENFTFSAWVNPDGIPAEIGKFALIGKKDNAVLFAYNADKRFELEFKLKDGGTGRTWTERLPSDRWYHIAAVGDAAAKEVRFYVNGRMHHLDKISAPPAVEGTEFNIGCGDPKQKQAFWYNGLVNDIRLYDRVLSQPEIQALFQAGSARYPVLPIPESVFYHPENAGGFSLLPAFAENAVSEQRKVRLRKEIPEQVEQYRKAIGELRAELEKRIGNHECVQKERIGKRAEIVENLIGFIRRNLNRGDTTGLLFAASGVQDLRHFRKYFQLELDCWNTFPRLPEGADPGNRPTVFNVRDFGAGGDGTTDDYAAFDKALNAMKALNGKPSILRIPAGTYFFNSPSPADGTPAAPGGSNLRISGLENAIIEGESPETTNFLFGRFRAAGLVLFRSKNVTIRNLTLQYQKEPFCQGTVLEVDVPNSTITIQHDPGTLTPDDQSFKDNPRFQRCTAYTPDGKIVRTQFIVYNAKVADSLGDGKFRIHMDKRYPIDHVRPGLKFVIPNREGEYPCVPFGDSVLCTAENIRIRNTRAASFQNWGGWWNTWTKCRIDPLEGRYLASNADALICTNGSYMSGCDVSSLGDDGFNAHCGGQEITRIKGNTAVMPRFSGISIPGNLIHFISSATGQYMALGIIRDNRESWNGQAVNRFEEPLPQTISTVESSGRKKLTALQEDLMSRYLIRYDESVDTAYDTHEWGIGTVVSNNRFSHGCSGINIQASNSLVENNIFENFPMGVAIAFSGLTGVKEGPAPYNIVARGNTVRDAWAGLRTHNFVQNMDLAQTAPVRGVLFENNRIEDTIWALLLRNTGDSCFRDNAIIGNVDSGFQEKPNQVHLERCTGIMLEGNTINGKPLSQADITGKENEASIQIGPAPAAR